MKKALLKNPETAAKFLLGCYIIREISGKRLVGRIVETEAYHEKDEASHSFNGKTKRNEVMFGPPGNAYIYFTYGMHWCFNVVTGKTGEGSAVLIRAVEPIDGISIMKKNRKTDNLKNLCSGPSKLCMAFKIDGKLNGKNLLEKNTLWIEKGKNPKKIEQGKRIGISKGTWRQWRFWIKEKEEWISKKPKRV